MTSKTTYTEQIQDPTTGETTTLTAATEAELDRLVEEHLGETFPDAD